VALSPRPPASCVRCPVQSLAPHPLYEEPWPNEWTCYKSGRLIFEGVRSLTGLKEQASVRPNVGPDDSVDYDCFDALNVVGEAYEVVGDFGDVRLSASSVLVEIDPRSRPAVEPSR
jgi:hypothetical protein